MLFFAYCGFVFIASFVGYFLNADRYSRLAWLLFFAVPGAGVAGLGWTALAAFVPAAVVGAMIFWRSPNKSLAGSQDGPPVWDEVDGPARGRASHSVSAASKPHTARPGTVEDDQITELIEASQRLGPIKTFTELLEEGHPHKGGLAQLAAAEKAGTLFGAPGSPAEITPVAQPHGVPPDEEQSNDPLLQYMRERGIPITRENYLGLAYADGLPGEWTAELEAHLPECIRLPLAAPDAHDSGEAPMTCYTWRLQEFDEQFATERSVLMTRLLEGVRRLPPPKAEE